MANSEADNGTTRDELVQRLALMETMIAEGRCTAQRFGWVFVAWGVCYIVASLWAGMGPHPFWAWPVCLIITILGVNAGMRRQAAASREPVTSMARTLSALWLVFGIGISLFVVSAVTSHFIGNGEMFISAICFFLGTVNVTSAAIYRWKMQGLAGAVWWAAGVTALHVSSEGAGIAFLAATFLSQICFGLYLMVLERRRAAALVEHHA